MQLPRGLRNNNPGNLEDGPFARSLPGYMGTDGRHAIFDTIDNGYSAMDRLLSAPRYRGARGIGDIISQWAPASDGNDVAAYTGYVSRRLGVDPNDPSVLSDPAKRSALKQAMAEYENGPDAMRAYAGGNPMTRGALSAYAAGDPEETDAAPQGILGQVMQGGLGAPFGYEGRPLGNSLMLAGLALQGKDPASLMWAMDRPREPKKGPQPLRPVPHFDKDGNFAGVFDPNTSQYTPAPGSEPMRTPGQKKSDETFAKDNDLWTSGGQADAAKSIAQLEDVSRKLRASAKKGPLNVLTGEGELGPTGPLTAVLPDWANSVINPEALDLRNRVGEIIQRGARGVLGAQYTQKEGENFFANTYNSRLSPDKVADRIDAFVKQLREASEAKQAKSEYFSKKGSLVGYQGKEPDFSKIGVFDEEPGTKVTVNPSQSPYKVLKVH